MDVAGDNQLNIEHEMLKQRLKPSGQLEGSPVVAVMGQVSADVHRGWQDCAMCEHH